MPIANWLSWLVIGPVIAWTLRRVAGPALEQLATDPLAPALYTLTGLLPLALALEFGLYGAAALGGAAMVIYLVAPRVPGVILARSSAPPADPRAPAAT
jgi:uncharacterized membrane protein